MKNITLDNYTYTHTHECLNNNFIIYILDL